MGKKEKFYAVAVGRKVGIYKTWDECQRQTKGFSKATFKSFTNKQDAEKFIQENQDRKPTPKPQQENESFAQTQKRTRQASHNDPTEHKEDDQDIDSDKSSSKRPKTLKNADDDDDIGNPGAMNVKGNRSIVLHLNFDGGSRGNPGLAGAGAEVLTRILIKGSTTKRQKTKVRHYLGSNATNNQAEYKGLIVGLEACLKILAEEQQKQPCNKTIAKVVVQGDSELIIKQIHGVNKCRNPKLKPLYESVLQLVKSIKKSSATITFEHVYRNMNANADALANQAMDARRSWTTTENDGDDEDKEGSTSDNNKPVELRRKKIVHLV